MREPEKILIMQELQPLPGVSNIPVNYNAGTRVVSNSYRDTTIGIASSWKILIAGSTTS